MRLGRWWTNLHKGSYCSTGVPRKIDMEFFAKNGCSGSRFFHQPPNIELHVCVYAYINAHAQYMYIYIYIYMIYDICIYCNALPKICVWERLRLKPLQRNTWTASEDCRQVAFIVAFCKQMGSFFSLEHLGKTCKAPARTVLEEQFGDHVYVV